MSIFSDRNKKRTFNEYQSDCSLVSDMDDKPIIKAHKGPKPAKNGKKLDSINIREEIKSNRLKILLNISDSYKTFCKDIYQHEQKM